MISSAFDCGLRNCSEYSYEGGKIAVATCVASPENPCVRAACQTSFLAMFMSRVVHAGTASRSRSRHNESGSERAISTPDTGTASAMHGTTPPEAEDRSGFATVSAETWLEGLRFVDAPATAPCVLVAAAELLGAVVHSARCEAWSEAGLLPTRLASECASSTLQSCSKRGNCTMHPLCEMLK